MPKEQPELKTFDDVKALIKDIVGPCVAEELEARRAKGNEAAAADPLAGTPEPAVAPPKGGNMFGRAVRYLAISRNDVAKARDIATKAGDVKLADCLANKSVNKAAMAEDVLSTGGALVVGDMSEEIIETLRAEAVVRKAGPRIAPMDSGSLTMPYGDTGSTASYTGESEAQSESTPTTGQLQFRARKLRVTAPVSNDLLRDTSGRGDVFIRDDVAGALGEREDLAFLRDDGTDSKPRGMYYWGNAVSNLVAANGTVSLANTTADLGKALLFPLNDNVRVRKGHWFFAPRTWNYLMTTRTTDGQLVWAPEMTQGTLMGFPFSMTTQIPINLGGSSNESEVIFADMNGCVIAEAQGIEIDVFPGGTWYDGSSLQSGVARDETVVRAIARHDFGCRYRGKEIGVLSGVKWGV